MTLTSHETSKTELMFVGFPAYPGTRCWQISELTKLSLACFEMNVSALLQTLADTCTLGWDELCVVWRNPALVKDGKIRKTHVLGLVIGNLEM